MHYKNSSDCSLYLLICEHFSNRSQLLSLEWLQVMSIVICVNYFVIAFEKWHVADSLLFIVNH